MKDSSEKLKMSDMKILLTGGLGTNGSWMIKKLVQEGNEVVSYDFSRDYELIEEVKDKIAIETGDLQNLGNIIRALNEHNIDTIVHSAALLGPKVQSLAKGIADPVQTFEVNGRGTLNILESAISSGVKRVVFVSSKAVYADPSRENGPPEYKSITEDYPKKSSTIYGLFKIFGEELGNLYSEIYGIEFVSLRYAAIYGPGRIRQGNSSTKPKSFTAKDNLIYNALQGVPTTIEDDGVRDELIYVKDVAKSVYLAASAKTLPRKCYHFGGGGFVTLGEYADVVQKKFPDSEIRILSKEYSNHKEEFIKKRFKFDSGAAKKDLGYVADFGLEEGINDYVSYVREHTALAK